MSFQPLTLPLICELSVEELEAKGQALAKLTQEIAVKEEEKKASAANFKGQLDTAYGEQAATAKVITDKAEERSVACEKHFDYKKGTYYIVRLDTGEKFESGELTDEEQQLGQNLFNQGET